MTAWPPFPAAPTLRKHKHTHTHTPSCKHKHTLFANTNGPLCKHALARPLPQPWPGHRPLKSTPRPPRLQVEVTHTSRAPRSKRCRIYSDGSNANPRDSVSHFAPRSRATFLRTNSQYRVAPSAFSRHNPIPQSASCLRPENWQHSCCVLRVQKRGLLERCDLEGGKNNSQVCLLRATRGRETPELEGKCGLGSHCGQNSARSSPTGRPTGKTGEKYNGRSTESQGVDTDGGGVRARGSRVMASLCIYARTQGLEEEAERIREYHQLTPLS